MDPEFDELKREFLAEAETKINEIRALLQSNFPLSKETVERVIYLSHQLKGAGGSYGFQSISTEAAALETGLEQAIENAPDDLQKSIRLHVENISTTIQTKSQELNKTAAS